MCVLCSHGTRDGVCPVTPAVMCVLTRAVRTRSKLGRRTAVCAALSVHEPVTCRVDDEHVYLELWLPPMPPIKWGTLPFT